MHRPKLSQTKQEEEGAWQEGATGKGVFSKSELTFALMKFELVAVCGLKYWLMKLFLSRKKLEEQVLQ
ncbi:MAG: hypothetical protein GY938_02985 [Ketobacter sp.]|nr:hypothetical protein [Ketobacter sp.]